MESAGWGNNKGPPPPREQMDTNPTDLRELALRSLAGDDDDEPAITAEIPIDVDAKEVPRLLVPEDELPNRLLSHREAFVVSLIDGTSSVQVLLEMGILPADKMLAILCNLRARGVIKLGR
jgi:hypothetical protein